MTAVPAAAFILLRPALASLIPGVLPPRNVCDLQTSSGKEKKIWWKVSAQGIIPKEFHELTVPQVWVQASEPHE